MLGELLETFLPNKKQIISDKISAAFFALSKESGIPVGDLRFRIHCTDTKAHFRIALHQHSTGGNEVIENISLEFILADLAQYRKTVSDKIRIFILDISEAEAMQCAATDVVISFIPIANKQQVFDGKFGIALYKQPFQILPDTEDPDFKILQPVLIREVNLEEIL